MAHDKRLCRLSTKRQLRGEYGAHSGGNFNNLKAYKKARAKRKMQKASRKINRRKNA